MAKDISKQTVTVLFVLAILVMLLGTFTVYTEASNLEVRHVEQDKGATGDVFLRVAGIPEESVQTGELTLTIVE